MDYKKSGFSLAEILIALGIIALISIFAIPKFRTTADTKMYKENTKITAMDVAKAYNTYKSSNNISSTTTATDIFENNLNYVRIKTVGQIDRNPCSGGNRSCTGTNNCYVFSSGAVAHFFSNASFGGTSSNHAIKFRVDPDGKVTGASGDAGKVLVFYLYYDGKVRSREQILTDTITGEGTDSPGTLCVPDWWSWD